MPRVYRSPAREAQADATRRRVLDAAVALLGDDAAAVEVGAIASAAGVSVPTVYRYFPNRDALMDALQAHLGAKLGRAEPPATLAEVPATAAARVAFYERNEAVVRAALATPGFLDALNRQRAPGITRTLAPATAHLSEADATAVRGLLAVVTDPRTWAALKDEWGADPEAVARTVGWALDALLERLDHDARRGS